MAEQQRDIEHYVANPDDVANIDQATAARLLQEMGGLPPPTDEPTEEAKPAEAKPEPEAKPAKEPDKPATDKPDAKAEEPKEGTAVLAPDGKSTIPYVVLQRERQRASTADQRATTAEAAVSELTEMVDKLTKRIEAQEASGKPVTAKQEGENAAAAEEISAVIEALRDEAPDVASAIDKIRAADNARIADLEKKLVDVTKSHEVTERAALQRINVDVQTAIDSNPALVHWRENNAELYEEAKVFDNMLREQPAWADRPFSDRFAQVVKFVVAAHDESVLPPAAAKAADPKGPALTAEQIKAQALAKLAKSAPVPSTLTDIPGGRPAEQTENERAENMDVTQLGAKFMRMTPEEQQAYLATIG